MSMNTQHTRRLAVTRAVAGASILAALAAHAGAQVSSVNLQFDGTGNTIADTGFESGYNYDATGLALFEGTLVLRTLNGDTYGNYETDPDTAKNMLYTNMAVGERTVVQARLKSININQNFHGGGIWVGTDQDHYLRLGIINNTFEGGVAVEALREQEDRWRNGTAFPTRPGAEIESRYLDINASAPAGNVAAILRIVRDQHAAASYVSLDDGATFTRIGGDSYSFNSLATDATSLPIDNRTSATGENPTTASQTVEGGFKVGAYALGGGTDQAAIQFDSFTAITGTPTYTGPNSGEYTDNANWNNNNGIGAPTNIESTAVLPSGAARSLTVSSNITATNIDFESAAGTTISGTGTVRFDWFFFPTHPEYYTDGPGLVRVTQGTHTISAPTTVAHLHGFDVAAGGVLHLSNMQASPADNTDAGIRKIGAGTLRANRLLTANVNVEAGTLQVTPSGTAANVSRVSNLTVNTAAGSTAKLDLSDNGLVLDYAAAATTSPLAATNALIASGYNGGAWNGPGIVSSDAAANSRRGLGIAEASELTTVPAFFGTVDASAVLIRLTLRGDADLDGTVNFPDLVRLAQNYNGTAKIWSRGDFNYDGTTNFTDLVALAQNYNQSLTAAQLTALGENVASDWALAQTLVPEPTTLAAVGLLGSVLLRRRRA